MLEYMDYKVMRMDAICCFILTTILTLLSCSNLDDINSRLDNLEGEIVDNKPRLLYLEFLSKDNREQLLRM